MTRWGEGGLGLLAALLGVALLALLLFGCATTPRQAAIGCIAADLATTAYGLAQGLEEQNHPGVALAGTILYFTWGGESPTGHRVVAGARCTYAAWNLRLALEAR